MRETFLSFIFKFKSFFCENTVAVMENAQVFALWLGRVCLVQYLFELHRTNFFLTLYLGLSLVVEVIPYWCMHGSISILVFNLLFP